MQFTGVPEYNKQSCAPRNWWGKVAKVNCRKETGLRFFLSTIDWFFSTCRCFLKIQLLVFRCIALNYPKMQSMTYIRVIDCTKSNWATINSHISKKKLLDEIFHKISVESEMKTELVWLLNRVHENQFLNLARTVYCLRQVFVEIMNEHVIGKWWSCEWLKNKLNSFDWIDNSLCENNEKIVQTDCIHCMSHWIDCGCVPPKALNRSESEL